MTYWLFDGSDVVGPFTVQQLLERGGFGPGSLVCPEAHASDETYWKAASGYADFGFGAAESEKPLSPEDLTLPEDAPDETFEQEMLDTLIGANCPLASPDEIEPAPAEPVTLRMPAKHPTRPSPIEDYFNNIKGEDLGNILGIPDPNENSDMNLQRALEHQFADTTPPVEKEIRPIENDPFDEFTSPDLEEDPDAVFASDKTPSAVLEKPQEPAPAVAAASEPEREESAREKARRQDDLTAAFAAQAAKEENPKAKQPADRPAQTPQAGSGASTSQTAVKAAEEKPVVTPKKSQGKKISASDKSCKEKITPPESNGKPQASSAEKPESVRAPHTEKQPQSQSPILFSAKTTPCEDVKPQAFVSEPDRKQAVKKPAKIGAKKPATKPVPSEPVQQEREKQTLPSKADAAVALSKADEKIVIVPSEEQLAADMPDAEEVSTLRIQLPEKATHAPVKDVKAEKAEAARLKAADEQAASEAEAVFAGSEREAAARAQAEAAILAETSADNPAARPAETPAPAAAKSAARLGVQMPSLPEDGALQAAAPVSAPEPEAEELVAQDDRTDPAAQTVKDILQGQLKVEEQPEVKEPIKEVPVAVEPEETRVKPRLNQTPEIEEFLTERVVRRSRKKPAGVLALLIALLVAGGAFYLNRSMPQEAVSGPAAPAAQPRQTAKASAPKADAARIPSPPATAMVAPSGLPDIPLSPVNKIAAADRARAIAQDYYLPEYHSTIGEYFDRIYKDKKAEGYTTAWSVDPLHKDVYIVKYRVTKTRKEPIMYIFQVDTGKDKLVGALNNVTLDLVGKIK